MPLTSTLGNLMLAGDPLQFAVEIFHEPESPRWKGFGRMCIHIEGVVLGRLHERHCSLFHAVERIIAVADQLPVLWDGRFVDRSDDSIFSLLDASLYRGTEPNDGNLQRFDFLTNTGEQFDDCKTFIYCTPARSVHLLYQQHDQPARSGVCTSKSFTAAASQLREWWSAVAQPINPPDAAR